MQRNRSESAGQAPSKAKPVESQSRGLVVVMPRRKPEPPDFGPGGSVANGEIGLRLAVEAIEPHFQAAALVHSREINEEHVDKVLMLANRTLMCALRSLWDGVSAITGLEESEMEDAI